MPRGIVKNAWVNSPQADEVARYYTDGHTVRETAEKFGVTKVQVNNLVKKRHLTNGVYWKDGAVKSNENRSKDAEQRIIKKLSTQGFDYFGGYETKESTLKIKCNVCGLEFERTFDWLKKSKEITCPECERIRREEEIAKNREQREKEHELERTMAQAMRNLEKWMKNPNGLSDYQLQREAEKDKIHTCKICGKKYTIRQYMESSGIKYVRNSGFCSDECRAVQQRRTHQKNKTPSNHRHRARRYGVPYESGITLKRLIKRDGLTCAICGEICDPNDHSWSKYCGPLYPTIDHIIPMSKGGGHTWNNVQVAHAICNSLKSDSIEKAVSL